MSVQAASSRRVLHELPSLPEDPPPAAAGDDPASLDDPGLGVLALEIKASSGQAREATDAIEAADAARQIAFENAREAERTAQADQDKSSFWDDVGAVAKVVAVVGGAAAAVATGGGGVVAVMALAGSGLTVAAPALKKAGLVSDDAASAMELAGTGLSLAAGGYTALYPPGADSALPGLRMAGRLTEGAGRAAEGVATIEAKGYEGRVAQDHADEAASTQASDQAAIAGDDARDRLTRAVARSGGSAQATISMLEDREAVKAQVLANMLRG